MIRRVLLVMAVAALMAAMMVAIAMPAFADAGGVPNENACAGQTNKENNQAGFTPREAAEFFGLRTAGDFNKFVRSGGCA
jgi:hypothetical protein